MKITLLINRIIGSSRFAGLGRGLFLLSFLRFFCIIVFQLLLISNKNDRFFGRCEEHGIQFDRVLMIFHVELDFQFLRVGRGMNHGKRALAGGLVGVEASSHLFRIHDSIFRFKLSIISFLDIP